ncbi:hypothetical protein AAY473_020234 [Plecturocebus cupreus]
MVSLLMRPGQVLPARGAHGPPQTGCGHLRVLLRARCTPPPRADEERRGCIVTSLIRTQNLDSSLCGFLHLLSPHSPIHKIHEARVTPLCPPESQHTAHGRLECRGTIMPHCSLDTPGLNGASRLSLGPQENQVPKDFGKGPGQPRHSSVANPDGTAHRPAELRANNTTPPEEARAALPADLRHSDPRPGHHLRRQNGDSFQMNSPAPTGRPCTQPAGHGPHPGLRPPPRPGDLATPRLPAHAKPTTSLTRAHDQPRSRQLQTQLEVTLPQEKKRKRKRESASQRASGVHAHRQRHRLAGGAGPRTSDPSFPQDDTRRGAAQRAASPSRETTAPTQAGEALQGPGQDPQASSPMPPKPGAGQGLPGTTAGPPDPTAGPRSRRRASSDPFSPLPLRAYKQGIT